MMEGGAVVAVVGSIHMDRYAHLNHFPVAGETVVAETSTRGVGGKGANQAWAAARAGARVHLIGAVGADGDGKMALELLAGELDVSAVDVVDDSTGSALVALDPDGQNLIVVMPGAGRMVTPDRVDAVLSALSPGVVLCQGELGAAVIEQTARTASRIGARYVLNLAPYVKVADEALAVADPLVVNETEAMALLGQPVVGDGLPVAEAERHAMQLASTSARSVVITLGGAGAVVCEAGTSSHMPAPTPAHVVDSTGAGDVFTGALTSALASGASVTEAVRHGVAAGAIAVTRFGTTTAAPSADELRQLLTAPADQAWPLSGEL